MGDASPTIARLAVELTRFRGLVILRDKELRDGKR